MTIKTDAITSAARADLYLSRAKRSSVFGEPLDFYPGSPSIPPSFIGNVIQGAFSGGAAAGLVNGTGSPLEEVLPCSEPTISSLQVNFTIDNTEVVVTYSNPLVSSDIYILLNPNSGDSFGAISASETGPDEVTALFPADLNLPPGFYSFKILRSENVNCFDIRAGIFDLP